MSGSMHACGSQSCYRSPDRYGQKLGSNSRVRDASRGEGDESSLHLYVYGEMAGVMETGGVPRGSLEQYGCAEPSSLLIFPFWPQPQRAETPKANRFPL